MFLHLDCRHYRGDRPCVHQRLCEGCPHYAPMGPRVLIIKLGALGDVVRTACLLPTLRNRPEPPHLTWVTAPSAVPLVERMPGVDRVLAFDAATMLHLQAESFDTVICLDKEPAPAALAVQVRAETRLGVGLSRYGTVRPLNEEADGYFRLGLDDEEKFHNNRKTYPQLVHEALGLEYAGEPYVLEPTEADRAVADARLSEIGLNPAAGPIVGLNPGAGEVFAFKAWREDGFAALARGLAEVRPDARCLLLGGPSEAGLLARIKSACAGLPVFDGGADLPLGPFAALVGRCDLLVSADTLAMHLAIAQRRGVVAIFGPTCPQEIDLYGRGEKIETPIECAPCYKRRCDFSPNCQDMNTDERVGNAVLAQLEALRPTPVRR